MKIIIIDVEQVDRERRVKMAVRSALLLECLERSGYFPEGSADEDRDRVLRRLYDFQGERSGFQCHLPSCNVETEPQRQGSSDELTSYFDSHWQIQNTMTFNIHTVYQVGGEVSGDIPLRPVGTAVYSRTVLLNHSCSGNTAR